jgi:hypothetical protein
MDPLNLPMKGDHPADSGSIPAAAKLELPKTPNKKPCNLFSCRALRVVHPEELESPTF